MNETQIAEWEELLQKAEELFSLLGTQQNPTTIIEAVGYETKETFCSALLAFFFKSQESHKLSDLFVYSLLEVVKDKTNDDNIETDEFINSYAKTEYTTEAGNRIDILITTDKYIIGIENKIYAAAYNDFKNYEKTVKYLTEKHNPKPKDICVLLSLYKQPKPKESSFIPISYDEFFERVKKNLGIYVVDADPGHLQFLLHFMKTIQNLTMNDQRNETMKDFLQDGDNAKNAQEFIAACDGYKKYLNQKVTEDKNIEFFRNKSKIITTTAGVWSGRNIWIACESLANVCPPLVIDIRDTVFPFNVYVSMYFKPENKRESGDMMREFLQNYANLSSEFTQDTKKGYIQFRINEPIPIDTIANEKSIPSKLINAFIAKCQAKAKQAGE